MSRTPRVIAITASAALMAGTGAAGAVLAVDTITSPEPVLSGASDSDEAAVLATPKDESVTVYREPGDDDYDEDDMQAAPPSTSWQSEGKSQKGNRSHSS